MPYEHVFTARGGLATRPDLLTVMDRKTLTRRVRAGSIVRVWHGVYALTEPDLVTRLAALDLMTGKRIVGCMHTAAALYGFATHTTDRVHILDPGVRMRPAARLMVHQRTGAPLRRFGGCLLTAPAWTAVEIARTQSRRRGLATLDSALRSRSCREAELVAAVIEQSGRRGIVMVRELLAHIDARSESAMESEARMVIIDAGLPKPELQYEITDRYGDTWRADFAWPQYKLIAEYDSIEWHSAPEAMLRDRRRLARLQECGWTVVPIVVTDLNRDRSAFIRRLESHMARAAEAV